MGSSEDLQDNQSNAPIDNWTPQSYFQQEGYDTSAYDQLLAEGRSAGDNITDFVGSALWNITDMATFGMADYFNLDQAIMGGEFEDVFTDDTYSEAEKLAFGGGLPSTASSYGASVGTVASFMLPFKYPKIPKSISSFPSSPSPP